MLLGLFLICSVFAFLFIAGTAAVSCAHLLHMHLCLVILLSCCCRNLSQAKAASADADKVAEEVA